MPGSNTRKQLWENVSLLMLRRYGGENLTRLAKEAKFGPGSATRLKEQNTSVGVDIVDKLAKLFKLEPWQMLAPGLDPDHPPEIAKVNTVRGGDSMGGVSAPGLPTMAGTPESNPGAASSFDAQSLGFYLDKITDRERHKHVAHAALQMILRELAGPPPSTPTPEPEPEPARKITSSERPARRV